MMNITSKFRKNSSHLQAKFKFGAKKCCKIWQGGELVLILPKKRKHDEKINTCNASWGRCGAVCVGSRQE